MSEVKRFNCASMHGIACMMPRENGVWVQYSDFGAAQSELAVLREQLALTEESNTGLSSTISADVIAYRRVCDELAALREELASSNADKEAYAQNAIDLRTSLDAVTLNLKRADDLISTRTADLLACGTRRKAAEQRNSELSKHLTQAHKFVEATYGAADSGTIQAGQNASTLWNIDESKAALKPTESGASE